MPIKVYMNNCRASLDVVVFNGLPAEKLQVVARLELLDGDWRGSRNSAMRPSSARRSPSAGGSSVGQKFSIGDADGHGRRHLSLVADRRKRT